MCYPVVGGNRRRFKMRARRFSVEQYADALEDAAFQRALDEEDGKKDSDLESDHLPDDDPEEPEAD